MRATLMPLYSAYAWAQARAWRFCAAMLMDGVEEDEETATRSALWTRPVVSWIGKTCCVRVPCASVNAWVDRESLWFRPAGLPFPFPSRFRSMWWSVVCLMWRIEALMGGPGTGCLQLPITRNKSAIASTVASRDLQQHCGYLLP